MKLICSIWQTCAILAVYNKRQVSMKTNQTMMVRIGDYSQPIEHLTMMGNLNSLWLYGNGIRAKKD